MTLKAGDTVRATKDYSSWLTKGQTYTVSRVWHDGTLSIAEGDTFKTEGAFSSDYFEKVSNEMNDTINLGITDGTYGDLTVENGLVSRRKTVVVQAFGNKLLVDLSARQSKTVEAQALLDQIASAAARLNLVVQYVPSLSTFFDPKVRWADFLKTGETSGLELSDDEKQVVSSYNALRDRFTEVFTLPEPPKPAYVKASVPKRVTNPLVGVTVGSRAVSRGGYSVPLAKLERLWNEARELWRYGKGGSTNIYLRGYRSVVNKASVTVGCQSIQRYQLEALAAKQGWAFD